MESTTGDRWRAWAEIDLDALRRNLAIVRSRSPEAGVIAVVKADAYGHGLERISQALSEEEVAFLGVAALDEAQTIDKVLQASGSAPQILLMGAILPQEMTVAVARGWHFTLSTSEELEAAAQASRDAGVAAKVHLAVDTGMGRIGADEEAFSELCRKAATTDGLEVQGLSSHLPSADEDLAFTEAQLQRFDALVAEVVRYWDADRRPRVHILNSAGVLGFGKRAMSRGCLARPGLMLYGLSPLDQCQEALRPVLTLKSRVRLIRDLPPGRGISYGRTFITSKATRVATLGIGYGDGYPRSLSGQGTAVLVGGVRCPLLGRVTMDQIMVDVSDLGEAVGVGDEVVIYGCQKGEEITVAEIASRAATIPWEVLTRLSRRVRRVYTG